ncbi:MAG: AbrB/MazE/SpoVT family DNA-binding domain-containing protein [Candidatus Fermentithermobacillus carboniphilus]|uniref:AbrB/MazE/SpoVT family DNA-binding domain-containing protein n=1 Tax=Candidatus Fermentithermobacillus carboniphilus TaxID=3085328 RepID=A0AAT9LDL9_9FIRM|nr:MAG: AbrB/MazE/SpoVT family DNA-binding domain-containing protein [Candidatus Fermentithermobacillus carboniphilus]
MAIVTVSSKGQIVIPAEIRKAHSIRQGDRFELRVSEGKLVLVPLDEKPFVRLYGAFKSGTSLVRALEAEHAREIEKES